jgi:thioredoxin reductase (NADPH)
MSSAPLPSALNPRTQAFPIQTAAQISSVRSAVKLRQSKKDEILFDVGDTNVPFFILLFGRMEIVWPDLKSEGPVATHGPREFTGEMTMISRRRCLVRGRVTEPGVFVT